MQLRRDFQRHSGLARVSAFAVATMLAAVLGCSGTDAELAHVEGIVRLDGQPLKSGLVTFTPTSGRSASGWIQEDGSYVLGTYDEGDGALVGMHRITITNATKTVSQRPNFESDQPRKSALKSPIPLKYTNPDASGLRHEVTADGENQVPLELTSK